MFTLPALSTEYVRVPVSATEAGTTVSPTSDAVTMAFVSEGSTPAGGDFKTASWETDSSQTPTAYYARCLVGPSGGATQLTAGIYDVWVAITDTPEVPKRRAGAIRVI